MCLIGLVALRQSGLEVVDEKVFDVRFDFALRRSGRRHSMFRCVL